MLAHGNGTKQQCVANLIKTARGEVPFERTKGISRKLIDAPSVEESQLRADASWVVSTYEPRVRKCEIALTGAESKSGAFDVEVTIE